MWLSALAPVGIELSDSGGNDEHEKSSKDFLNILCGNVFEGC